MTDLIIGAGVKFVGEITVPNRALIGGSIDGDVTAKIVEVTQTGVIDGVVNAPNIKVFGQISKEIHCHELLSIGSSGKVNGTVDYGDVEIAKGGRLSGLIKSKT